MMPLVPLFRGPGEITVAKGATAQQKLNLSSLPAGIQFSTNVAWATVTPDGTLVIDGSEVLEGTHVVSIHASGPVEEDTLVRVIVQ
jgi:hypothetical protein